MDFEWDSRKRLANLRKHGLDFSDAWKVFAGLVLRATLNKYQTNDPVSVSFSPRPVFAQTGPFLHRF
jgi:uncharacterized protein